MSDKISEENEGREENFAEMFESYSRRTNEDIRVGDKINGQIISIGKESVFIDTGSKIDGVVDKEELLDEKGQLAYKQGDVLDLYVVSNDGNEIRLSRALSGIGGLDLLREAFQNKIPVEGKVKETCKGGFNVQVLQRRAFCPISQIDLRYVENENEYVGQTFEFLVTQLEERGKNIVLSRRELLRRELEKSRKEFLEKLSVGQELEGKVTKLMPYGAFVEIFPGTEGMVHLSELSWSRVEKPEEVLKEGDMIRAKVIAMEQEEPSDKMKISLSLKQITGDPWETEAGKFQGGDKVKGRVTRCAKFGAFVEISPGVEGLVHLSEMSYRKRVLKPEEVVRPGDTVAVLIKEVDLANKRISLSIKDAEGDPWVDVQERYRVGQFVMGTVEKKEKFGYFVTLEPGITGLLPASKIRKSHSSAAIEKLKEGDGVAVLIEQISPADRKITLTPGDSKEESDWQKFATKEEDSVSPLGAKLQEAFRKRQEVD